MPFTEAIRIAFQSLRANKLRSFLTVLGILIGVSSVIAVVAITEGLDGYITDQVLELGSKSFRLQKQKDIITSHEEWKEMMKRKRLNMDDLEAVQKACSLCVEVGASVNSQGSAKRGRIVQNNVQITGITENVSRIGTVDLEADTETIIQVTNSDTVGFVILDALQLLPVKPKLKTNE